MSATLVFTPIVHGPHDGRPLDGTLRCTVHVGIRLDPGEDPALASLAGWPELLAWPTTPLELAVVFADGSMSAPQSIAPTDPALWQGFLPPETPVAAYPDPAAPPSLDGPTAWYDGMATASYAQQCQTEAGKAVIGIGIGGATGLVAAPISGRGLNTAITPPAPPPLPATISAQLGGFFTNPVSAPPPPPPVDIDDAPATLSDFHTLIATLHGVPDTLPQLRLAIPLEVPWPAALALPSAIQLAVTLPPGATFTAMTPWAEVVATTSADGLLSPELWAPIAFDLSGAAHSFATTTGSTALRSAGFALLRLPQAGGSSVIADLQARSTRAAGLGASPASAFAPADVQRGWRVDALDQTRGVWRSLCQITGAIARNGQSVTIAADGTVAPVAATDPDGTLRANDTLIRWLGWSVVASPPGATTPGPAAASGFALTRAVVPGSLPPLRYGRSYSFRLRAADVLGDGLALTDLADATGASPLTPFLRLEPVAAPMIVFGTPAQPGEAPAQLVVLSGPSIKTPAASLRYLLPPACSAEVALLHGVLDTHAGIPDPAAAARLRTGNAWTQTLPAGAYPLKADVYAATTFHAPPAVPYLPDPAAASVAFRCVAGGDAIGLGDMQQALFAPFAAAGAAYPDGWSAAAVQLLATDGPGTSTIDGMTITCGLPPGQSVTVALSTAVHPALLSHFAIPAWVAADLGADAGAIHAAATTNGAVPAISPVQILTLLHATQLPVIAPAFAAPGPALAPRQRAETTMRVTATVMVDADTTASASLAAQWSEWVDGGPGTPVPALVQHNAALGQFTWPAGATSFPIDITQQLHTTAEINVTLTPTGQSAFAEMFPPGTDCARAGPPSILTVDASSPPLTPRVLYGIPTFAWSASSPTPLTVTRTRAGNALRLWLERPFFTSGTGERLAVLLGAAGDSTSLVSRWGVDPVTVPVNAPGIGTAFGAGDFIASTAPRVFGPPGITLALHDVHYHPLTDRYFCDVVCNPAVFGNAYRPFVQLVVAAFQPLVIAQVSQLSTSVALAPIQVFSDRALTLSLSSITAPSVSVALTGRWPVVTDPTDAAAPSRGLTTTAGLDISFDGLVLSVLDETDPGDGGGGGGHGNPFKILSTTEPPSFSDDDGNGGRTFSIDSDGYRVGTRIGQWKGVWNQCTVVVTESELAAAYTVPYTLYELPNGQISNSVPPGTHVVAEATFPSWPYPLALRLVYQDQITINSNPTYAPPPGAALQVVAIRKHRTVPTPGVHGTDAIAFLGVPDVNQVPQPIAVSDAITLIQSRTNSFFLVDPFGVRAAIGVAGTYLRAHRDDDKTDNLLSLPSF